MEKIQETEKNAMITTFKIMKIVMETLRETSEAGKEANKEIKKEWKAISKKQSQNHLESKENMGSNQFYTMVPGIMKLVTPYAFNALVDSGYHQTLGGTAHWLGGRSGVGEWGQKFMEKPFAEKWVKDDLPGYLDPVTKMGEQITGQFAQTEQYTNAVKESLYQHDVQTCTSDYQNGTQQQTSDKQSVDNAADTAGHGTALSCPPSNARPAPPGRGGPPPRARVPRSSAGCRRRPDGFRPGTAAGCRRVAG